MQNEKYQSVNERRISNAQHLVEEALKEANLLEKLPLNDERCQKLIEKYKEQIPMMLEEEDKGWIVGMALAFIRNVAE